MCRIYSYQMMKRDLKRLSGEYSEILKLFCLAKTADGRKIYGVCLGNPGAEKRIVIQASMHAREWFNTELVMRMIERYCRQWRKNAVYKESSYRRLLEQVCFFILPMVNPDGVIISQYGVKGLRNKGLQKNVKERMKGRHYYWKANARGVDLNRNYSTGFASNTADCAGEREFAGEYPFSERETRALVKLIRTVKPCLMINYHSAGHLIYYREEGVLVQGVKRLTGYKLCREMEPANGNLGDWLSELGIEWCTVETCIGKAPAGSWQLLVEWGKHRDLIAEAAYMVRKSKL